MKTVFIGLGFLFLGLGVIGATVPILPTVPFLLLASFFFAKGSDRINNWFTSTAIYKKHLESYVKTNSMTLKTKCKILAISTSMMLIGFYFSKITIARIVILVLMLCQYYYFFFKIKTIRED